MISIEKYPINYLPAGQPNIWKMSSDNADISFFRCELVSGSKTVSTFDLYVTPDTPLASYTNISRILQDIVTWGIPGRSTFLSEVENTVADYHLEITEKVFSGGVLSDGDTKTSDTKYVWDATTSNSNYFLTTKPDYVTLNALNYEMLYFLTDASFKVEVKLYDGTKTLIDSHTYNKSITGLQMYRANVSPRALLNEGMQIEGAEYFTVQVTKDDGTPLSELRTYLLDNSPCGQVPVNLLWVNNMGGVDSYQFVNPTTTIDVDRTTVKRNEYLINGSGDYSNINNGIYNPKTEIINTDSTVTYQIHTRPLTDKQAKWLKSLYTSKNVWVELSTGDLFPVQIKQSSYTINKQRYLGSQANIVTVSIEVLQSDVFEVEAKSGLEFEALINANGDFLQNNNDKVILV